MRNQKVLNKNQVNWYDEDSTRLSYQMIFNELEKEKEKEEAAREKKEEEESANYADSRELTKLLDERDSRWRNKLKRTQEDARAEGYEKGFQEGLEQARAEIDQKLSAIREVLLEGQKQWSEYNQLLEPGMLDMVFDISESILGIPVENPEIRDSLDTKLRTLLQKIDEKSKPLLLVSEEDYSYIENLVEEFSSNTNIIIRKQPSLNPGEFELDTSEEKVVHIFREMLDDFKKKLTLPSWK